MNSDSEIRLEALRLSERIREFANTVDADPQILAAALLEVGLQFALADSRRTVSAAEKKLVRARYPEATDEDIATHCLSPDGVAWLLSLITTVARKYLDHQPEACTALGSCRDDNVIDNLVAAATVNLSNAFASAEDMGVSAYDVLAAVTINASILANRRGVPIEQAAIVHLDCIMEGLKRAGPDYGV